MNARLHRFLIVALVVGSAVAANGCYHVKTGGGPYVPPTGSGSYNPSSPTPTPQGNCQTLLGNTTAIIDVAADILPTKDPTYGNVWGYGLQTNPSNFPLQASVVKIAPNNQVQFFNIDTVQEYSAVGLGGNGFPTVPHTFPTNESKPLGAAINTNVNWSTGRLGAASTGCFSQQFSLPQVIAGQSVVVYFGDYDLYNFGFRDAMVVSNSGAQGMRGHPLHIRLPH